MCGGVSDLLNGKMNKLHKSTVNFRILCEKSIVIAKIEHHVKLSTLPFTPLNMYARIRVHTDITENAAS